jgi:hypothetical protein
MTEQRNTKRSLDKSCSRTSLKKSHTISRDDKTVATRFVKDTHGSVDHADAGGDTNRTRENQRVECMIMARRKQRADQSVMSKSSGKTMNNSKGEVSRNMVYEESRPL